MSWRQPLYPQRRSKYQSLVLLQWLPWGKLHLGCLLLFPKVLWAKKAVREAGQLLLLGYRDPEGPPRHDKFFHYQFFELRDKLTAILLKSQLADNRLRYSSFQTHIPDPKQWRS